MTDIRQTGLVSYLLSNRAFMAQAVQQAVDTLDLAGRRRLLDAGTGAGGALPPLALAGGPDALVLGVDAHHDALTLADTHATEKGVASQVSFKEADLLDVLGEAGAAGGTFDAIWASDVVWPGNFEDPAEAVALMAQALAPDGTLAIFTSNYYQSMFLPGHSQLQNKLRMASELNWGIPGSGPTHYERHVHWVLASGLREVGLRVIPRIGFPADSDPSVRPYLEKVVFPELLEAARSAGQKAGMSAEEVREAEELMSPGPRYVLDDPGYYVVHPTLLVTGVR
ncbi:class I SAM-dependent methyltransferase [Streptomyces sp. PTY087I2]|uniref:class I SAM-dependent methyltransferase n=1 Tax=Streptomyces sp. PTY087I2 TaxID=1819298 RepID=UPI00080B6F9E|nr:class I SAM-dependent methyltransferase [Streptomyces sp. PTY087I2]OCC14035.1 Demethylrebeccamycin-D-glucose O-methyltransferase [Streptomyces sp. PTY087I2]